MQEDKQLQELLNKYAAEEISFDFSKRVMQRVNTIAAAPKPGSEPLFSNTMIKVVISLFIMVGIALLVLGFSIQITQIPFHFTVKVPAIYLRQIASFLVAFWVVMLLNQLSKKWLGNVENH